MLLSWVGAQAPALFSQCKHPVSREPEYRLKQGARECSNTHPLDSLFERALKAMRRGGPDPFQQGNVRMQP